MHCIHVLAGLSFHMHILLRRQVRTFIGFVNVLRLLFGVLLSCRRLGLHCLLGWVLLVGIVYNVHGLQLRKGSVLVCLVTVHDLHWRYIRLVFGHRVHHLRCRHLLAERRLELHHLCDRQVLCGRSHDLWHLCGREISFGNQLSELQRRNLLNHRFDQLHKLPRRHVLPVVVVFRLLQPVSSGHLLHSRLVGVLDLLLEPVRRRRILLNR